MEYSFTVDRVSFSNGINWIAESELKGCVAYGKTLTETLDILETNEKIWKAYAREFGLVIPRPKIRNR